MKLDECVRVHHGNKKALLAENLKRNFLEKFKSFKKSKVQSLGQSSKF